MRATCTVVKKDGTVCGNHPTVARGMCNAHYRRWLKHDDPLGEKTPWGEPMAYFLEHLEDPPEDECLPWPYATDRQSYGIVRTRERTQKVATLTCEHHYGPRPAGMTVRHATKDICPVGANCWNFRHLSWGSMKEQSEDKRADGTDNRGERNGNAKLTDVIVQDDVWPALLAGETQRSIARRLGVDQSIISRIAIGKGWAHIPRPDS